MAFGNETCKNIVENVCPYCGQVLLMNKRVFANHVRWCKSNPRYEDIRNSTIAKNKANIKKAKSRKLNCVICNTEYEIECTDNMFNKGKYKKTCCDACSKQLTAKNTDITVKIDKLKSHYIHNIITKQCKHCGKTFETRKKNQIYCSPKCASKSKYAHNMNVRKYYRHCCCFNFVLNAFPEEFDFTLVEKFGWYKAKNHGNNLNGISRDHMISQEYGYKNLIDPYIISHPANCKLLRHNENSSKHSGCSLTVDELLQRIFDWHKKYGVYENTIDYTYFDKNNISLLKFDTVLNILK
jgi:YgiT-type zinc finger domain-containing protein